MDVLLNLLLLLCLCCSALADAEEKPNCDALTQEYAQLLNEFTQLKDEKRNLMQENTNLTQENTRLAAHIDILMRERTPTPPPVKSCPGGWKTFGDGCYYRSTETRSWQEGRDYCQSQGADLVVINSPAEQEFIGRGGTGGSWWYSWIGLKRSGSRSSWTWTWVDGTPLTTTWYWYSNGYPHNDEDRNCAFYRHPADSGAWRNDPCSHRRFALCEK